MVTSGDIIPQQSFHKAKNPIDPYSRLALYRFLRVFWVSDTLPSRWTFFTSPFSRPRFTKVASEKRNHIFCLGPRTSLWVNQLYFWFLRPFQTQFLLGVFCLFYFLGSTKTWILYFQHNSGQLTSFRGLVSETCGFRSTGYDKESCNKAPPLGLWVRRFGVPNLGSLEFFCTWNVWSCIYNMLDCCMRISICLHICIYIHT